MAVATEPVIIQGGMGVAASGWKLARAVALEGQLGVVSGAAIDVVLARRLQLGDPGGHMRRGLAEFPYPDATERILAKYFVSEGKSQRAPFRAVQALQCVHGQRRTGQGSPGRPGRTSAGHLRGRRSRDGQFRPFRRRSKLHGKRCH